MDYKLPKYDRVKGIHPGVILKRELKRRNIKAVALAKSIEEYPQTINAITKEKRGVNAKLSIKLGDYFNVEKEYFMLLQASFEVNASIRQSYKNPLIGKVRSIIFWDTDFNKIDLVKNKRSVIKRILERGNESEIKELIAFYSKPTIEQELEKISNSLSPNFDRYIYDKP